MKLSTLIFIIGGTAAGIYLQSEEGNDSRKKLKESLDNVTPVLKDMAKKLESMVKETESIRSDEIRVNVERKIVSLKKTIAKIDANKVASVTDDTIKSIAKKFREIRTEITSEPVASVKVNSKISQTTKISANSKPAKNKLKSINKK